MVVCGFRGQASSLEFLDFAMLKRCITLLPSSPEYTDWEVKQIELYVICGARREMSVMWELRLNCSPS